MKLKHIHWSHTISNLDVIKFFLGRLWTHKRWYGIVLVVAIAISRSDRSIPMVLQYITDGLTTGKDRNDIQPLFVWIIIYKCVSLIGWRINDRIVSWTQHQMLAKLHNEMRYTLQHHGQQFFANTFGGKLTKNMSKLARWLEDTIDTIVFSIMPLVIGVIIMVFHLWSEYRIFAMAILGRIGIYSLIQYTLYARLQNYSRRFDRYDSKFGWYVADTITNHSTIHNFAMLQTEYKTYQKKTHRLYKLLYKWRNMHNLIHGINSVLIMTLQLWMMYVIVRGVISGTYTIGVFVMMQTYLTRLFEQMFWIWQTIKRIFSTLSESIDMLEILSSPIQITDQTHAKILQISQARIDFSDVSFMYHHDSKVFQKLNLHISWGQKIGIVWQSGEGKTTLIKLLMRVYDVTSGMIMIDGQNIAQVTQQSLRSHIALVSQEPLLFHRTLYENISYAMQDASMEMVIEAARKAQCHDFISRLHDGYDTLVWERGVKLSWWERQRVAIARAILADRPILILDEATSSLDTQSEYAIQQAMKYAMQGKTTLVIAHRLSTLLQMDRIIVMQGWSVIQDGTHQDLIEDTKGLYATLWSHQKAWFV